MAEPTKKKWSVDDLCTKHHEAYIKRYTALAPDSVQAIRKLETREKYWALNCAACRAQEFRRRVSSDEANISRWFCSGHAAEFRSRVDASIPIEGRWNDAAHALWEEINGDIGERSLECASCDALLDAGDAGGAVDAQTLEGIGSDIRGADKDS